MDVWGIGGLHEPPGVRDLQWQVSAQSNVFLPKKGTAVAKRLSAGGAGAHATCAEPGGSKGSRFSHAIQGLTQPIRWGSEGASQSHRHLKILCNYIISYSDINYILQIIIDIP